jgi:hypothetical protein
MLGLGMKVSINVSLFHINLVGKGSIRRREMRKYKKGREFLFPFP